MNSWTQFPTCGVETYPHINQTILGYQQVNCSGKLSYAVPCHAQSLQSRLTLCYPMDCSLVGVSVRRIFQTRILEWVAMPSSRGSSQPRNWTGISFIAVRFFTSWLTRKAHYKRIDFRNSRWKRCRGQGMGWGYGASMLCPSPPQVHQPGNSLNPILLDFYDSFIMYVWLIKSLAVADLFNLQPLSPPQKSRSGTENSNPLIPIGYPDNPSLSLDEFQIHSLTHKRHLSGSYHFSSVVQSCSILCDLTDCSMPGFPVLTNSQSLPKLISIESVMPSNQLIFCHPLLLLPSIFPSIRVFSNESVLHITWPKYWRFSFSISPSNARVLELQLQHQSFQWIFRTDFLQDWLVGSPCSPRDSQESSPTPQFKSINSLALSFLYGPPLTSICGYWKSHSFD